MRCTNARRSGLSSSMNVLMRTPRRVTRSTSFNVSTVARDEIPPTLIGHSQNSRPSLKYAVGWPSVITIICLVGLQNAINMVDGMNGLLIGLAVFWTGCMMYYAPDHLAMYLKFLMLGLLIVLPFNLSGTLFLGDAGSYSIGATIGVLMIYCWNEADGALPMLTVVLWLLVPVLDCLRVMGIRLWSERSPLIADRNHLHHRLARHWRWPTCLLVYLTLVALPGAAAAARPLDLTLPMIVVALVAYSSLLWLTRDRTIPTPQGSPGLV